MNTMGMHANSLIVEGLADAERMAMSTWMQGDTSAVEFADLLVSATHAWDDLIDKDKEVAPDTINKAFMALSIGLMRNDFFAANVTTLLPLLEQAMYDWIDSNKFEEMAAYPVAYTLRCAFATPIIRCAYIIGGYDWGQAVSVAMRAHLFNDFDIYMTEHGGS
jgi:hypothetical protein